MGFKSDFSWILGERIRPSLDLFLYQKLLTHIPASSPYNPERSSGLSGRSQLTRTILSAAVIFLKGTKYFLCLPPFYDVLWSMVEFHFEYIKRVTQLRSGPRGETRTLPQHIIHLSTANFQQLRLAFPQSVHQLALPQHPITSR